MSGTGCGCEQISENMDREKMSYSFRMSFPKSLSSASSTLQTKEWKMELPLHGSPHSVTFSSPAKEEASIYDTDKLIVSGSGYESYEAAEINGQRIKNALMATCARHRMGLDFSEKNITMTESFITSLEKQRGRKHIEQVDGHVIIFNSEDKSLFCSTQCRVRVATEPDIFLGTFITSLKSSPSFSERERLAYRLFNTALFQPDILATFLFLVITIEALSDYAPRSEAAIAHVDMLIESTKNSHSLTKEDSDSMVGALRWLKQESIKQAGKRLVTERLGNRRYAGMIATKYFSECYDLRSRLAHSGTLDNEKFNKLAPHLSFLVSDLLTAPVLGPRDEE
ncbi:hypothetical protein VU06_03220 [Desulfobulbus sp. F3]|nr:hypothetical protein [Desulfobulbus sp. F3]